ncbi:hypothetical protein CMO92_02735 [Candidatus Woesearchaeota archaeon]|nr:hypothetical protein [Candidatus Woesearchaeota archaeon]|tara:strand:- start:133 stop:615 length:483 start_codon:yes stop_codon:yes gene_type:complete
MVDPDVIQWVKTQKKQGYTEEQLTNSMLQRGYSMVEAKEAIHGITAPQQQKKKSKLWLWILIGALILIALVVAGYFTLFTTPAPDDRVTFEPLEADREYTPLESQNTPDLVDEPEESMPPDNTTSEEPFPENQSENPPEDNQTPDIPTNNSPSNNSLNQS